VQTCALPISGLGHLVRHGIEAVNAFIETAPERLNRDHVDLMKLRNPQLWREFHRRVRNRVKLAMDLLDDPGRRESHPFFQFNETMKLGDVLNDAVTSAADELRARAIQVLQHVPADLPALSVDGPKFLRIFKHLLRFEFIQLAAAATVQFTALRSGGNEIEVTMTDTGHGLPDD